MVSGRPSDPSTALALVGPTASGKSALALALALADPGWELVAVDAMTVYRGMDIGTAKPTVAERALVPYHGLDVANPSEDYTVVRFQHAYAEIVTGIRNRGNRPLLVGGTGLYVRAVIDGFEPPPEDRDLRRALESDSDTAALYDRLVAVDPLAASRMEPTNRRRIVRALEVCLATGRPFSSFGPGLDAYPPTPVVQVGLRWPRAALTARIRARYDAMLAAGLLDEVRALRDRPDGLSRTARQALGYKELLDHLDGRSSLADAIELAITRTRQFAVRQERWFRRDPRIHWIDLDQDPFEAMPLLLGALAACASR
jgi:tRNA dimethylallyltransferase